MNAVSRAPINGPAKPKIMVVGGLPDASDLVEGGAFKGSKGELLKKAMLAAGLNPRDVTFTNVCEFLPKGKEAALFDKKGMPDPALVAELMRLKEEINAADPTVIMPLGNLALWATSGCARWSGKMVDGERATWTGIDDWRGSIIEGARTAAGRKLVAAYHPELVQRKFSSRVFLDLDLKRAREQSAFSEIRRPVKTIAINPEGQDRLWWRDRILSGKVLTFDIEYIGSNLLCVGMTSNADEACVIRTRNASDIRFVQDLLQSGMPLCAQNGMFDCSILEYWYKFDLFKNLKYDTMLAAHAAYIELPKDLGTLCSIYTEQPCYWTHIDWDKIKKGLQPIDDVLQYNAIDAWVTHAVMEAQESDELKDPKVRRTFEFEMSLLAPLWEISKRGVYVDRHKLDALRAECEANIEKGVSLLEGLCGRRINVSSPKDVPWLLFDFLGFKPTKVKTRGPSTDDYVLADLGLAATTPLQQAGVKLVRDVRKSKSLISKFCNLELDADGRFRSHFNPAGTTTGRLASRQFFPTGTGGNGQNIPRDKRCRRVFVPDPGHVFFYNDLERAESLVVAHLTGDPTMLAHHAPGADGHRLLASELFNKPKEEVAEDERYLGKQTRHAGNYMEGWMTFMKNVNKLAAVTGVAINAKQAKYFIGKYRELHPFLGTWWRNTEVELRSNGKLYNLLGRPRQFFDRLDSILPVAIAYRPQSTVGDVLNIALLRCYNDEELRRMGVQLLLQVHDAIGGQVPAENVEPAMARMRELMRVDLINPRTGEEFYIPVEIAFGLSWGDVKKWEGDLQKEAV